MPARLRFLPLVLVATAGLFALTTALTAQPPNEPALPTPDGTKRSQEENLRFYKKFADELLKLAQKWEKSDNPDEKERAKTLRAALKIAEEKGVENMFKQIIDPLSKPPGTDLGGAIQKDKALIAALKEVLETLDTEDEAEKNKRLRMETEAFLKEAKRILREQEILRARTEGKGDPTKTAKDQNQLAKETKDLANQLAKGDSKDGKGGDPKGGEQPKDDKSEQKPDSSKPGEPSAEPKPDTKDPKSTDKDPMGGEPKGGEPKPGDPKGGMPMAGSSKEPPKEGPMGDPMGAKPMGDPMPMNPTDPKPMDPKPSDSKSQGMGKGDSKPSKGMGGDAKPMPPSDGSPSDSPPMSGSPKGGPPSGGSPMPPSKRPPNPNNPNDDAQRDLDDAVPDQKEAEKKLNEKKNDEAGKNQDDALDKIARAIKELEKRLKQLREKEMRQKLEDLERRVNKMLQMQIEVYEATKRIDNTIKKNNNETVAADRQKATVEADKEGNIALEAAKALRLLEGEGTAVVFAGVLEEARKDMEAVKKELDRTNVGPDTQLIEEQIIAQLKRMLEALKKAKQDLDQPPPPPPPGMPPPPSDPKKNLIQLVEQLKLLKELQIQVNERTTAFGKRTPGAQATDSLIQEQLKLLSDRQETLKQMLQKVADQKSQ